MNRESYRSTGRHVSSRFDTALLPSPRDEVLGPPSR